MIWFSEGQANVLGRTAWLGLLNPLRVAQAVRVSLIPESGPEQTVTVEVPARRRIALALHDRLTGNFATEVEFAQAGGASLVMWDKNWQTPNVAQPIVGCVGGQP